MVKKTLLVSLLVLLLIAVGFLASSGGRGTRSLPPVVAATAAVPTDHLQLWLTADAGVTPDAANKINAWADQSGQHMDATQATPAAQPLFVNGAANGKPAIRFDGKQSYLNLPAGFTDYAQGLSIFAVVNPSRASAWGRIIELSDKTHGFCIMRNNTSAAW